MRIILILCLVLLFNSCAESQPNSWNLIIKDEKRNLESYYFDHAISIDLSGNVISGPDKIVKNHFTSLQDIKDISVLKSFIAGNNKYRYEIGTFIIDKTKHVYLTIAENNSDIPKHHLEFVTPLLEPTISEEVLNAPRASWIKMCNNHNAYKLVKEMYTGNAIYYNHKPVVIGTDAIAAEYSYMNNLEYKLHLEPIFIKMISDNSALEIGQCSGSYGGKYILLWTKEANGQWKVLMDSNV